MTNYYHYHYRYYHNQHFTAIIHYTGQHVLATVNKSRILLDHRFTVCTPLLTADLCLRVYVHAEQSKQNKRIALTLKHSNIWHWQVDKQLDREWEVKRHTRSRVKLYWIVRTRTRMSRPPRLISLRWRSRNHAMCFRDCCHGHTHTHTHRHHRTQITQYSSINYKVS